MIACSAAIGTLYLSQPIWKPIAMKYEIEKMTDTKLSEILLSDDVAKLSELESKLKYYSCNKKYRSILLDSSQDDMILKFDSHGNIVNLDEIHKKNVLGPNVLKYLIDNNRIDKDQLIEMVKNKHTIKWRQEYLQLFEDCNVLEHVGAENMSYHYFLTDSEIRSHKIWFDQATHQDKIKYICNIINVIPDFYDKCCSKVNGPYGYIGQFEDHVDDGKFIFCVDDMINGLTVICEEIIKINDSYDNVNDEECIEYLKSLKSKGYSFEPKKSVLNCENVARKLSNTTDLSDAQNILKDFIYCTRFSMLHAQNQNNKP